MTAIVIPEDGTGLSTANSIYSLAELDTIIGQQYYLGDLELLTVDQRSNLLILGTDIFNRFIVWPGTKLLSTQALFLPRLDMLDWYETIDVSFDQLKQRLEIPFIEFLKSIIRENRLEEPTTKGIRQERSRLGSLETEKIYDPTNRKQIFSDMIRSMIQRVAPGVAIRGMGGSMTVELVRS